MGRYVSRAGHTGVLYGILRGRWIHMSCRRMVMVVMNFFPLLLSGRHLFLDAQVSPRDPKQADRPDEAAYE